MNVICVTCDGRGWYLDAPGNVLNGPPYKVSCTDCKGTGQQAPVRMSVSITLISAGPLYRVGKLYATGPVRLEGSSVIHPWTYFAVMDRRQARRVARRTGRKFTVRHGTIRWRR